MTAVRLTASDRAALAELLRFSEGAVKLLTSVATAINGQRLITLGLGMTVLERLIDSDDEPTEGT